MALGVNTQTNTHIHTYRCANLSNFKKPGVLACGWHMPGLKRGIGIESEKYVYKLETKKVLKQVKDGDQ